MVAQRKCTRIVRVFERMLSKVPVTHSVVTVLLIGASFFVILVGGVFIAYLSSVEETFKFESSELGTIGDFVGGLLNPLLTFISIGVIAYTLLQNRDALRMSAEELRLSREEMKLIRQEYEKTAKAQSKQARLAEESNKYNAMKDLAGRLEEELLHNLDVLRDSIRNQKFYSALEVDGGFDNDVIKLFDLISSGGVPKEIHVIDGPYALDGINNLFGEMFSVAEVVNRIDKEKVTKMIGLSSYLKSSSVVLDALYSIKNLTIKWTPEPELFGGKVISYEIKNNCCSVIAGLESELLILKALVKKGPIILK